MVSNILDDVLSHGLVDNVSEEVSRLLEVTVWMVWSVSADKTCDSVWSISGIFREGEGLEAVGIVIWLLSYDKFGTYLGFH